MSKIEPDKINFDKDDFVVAVGNSSASSKKNKNVTQKDLERNRLDAAAQEIINKARQQAQEIIDDAEAKKKALLKECEDVMQKAELDSKKRLEIADKEKDALLSSAKEEIEKQKTDSANLGYQDGYKDGEIKLYEELEEKIQAFDNFCANQYEIKNKILKSASKDILDIILNISRKILMKELDGETIAKIIEKTISLFEKKENINIILSEKYARLIFEFQKKTLNDEEAEFNFEEFKQFNNFNILYNPKLNDDTIIIENQKERFDASVNAQLDIIIRDITEATNGEIEDIEQYGEDETNRAE